MRHYLLLLPVISFLVSCDSHQSHRTIRIDRFNLVSRHNVVIDQVDSLSPLSVGNGEFAFTADITGMQTFPEAYENGIPLGTQSQWAWHTSPTDQHYIRDDVAVYYETCREENIPYAVQHKKGRPAEAAGWLRANPHRLHLGMIGMELLNSNNQEIGVNEIQHPRQTLDLWTGMMKSRFDVNGIPVEVETISHQDQDMIAFRVHSSMILSENLKFKIRFPSGDDCGFCPGYRFDQPQSHESEVIDKGDNFVWIKRALDSTQFYVQIRWAGIGSVLKKEDHFFELSPGTDSPVFEFSVAFNKNKINRESFSFPDVEKNTKDRWAEFWTSGGAIDFSNCTDSRAFELERRIILSQYLTKIQCSGSMPPQETGLTYNSWFGKFHMEMHWWHAAHFALWGRPELMEKSLGWYFDNLENARETARWQGYDGVRWQKMTSPEGKSSPSSVGEFLIWQQPHIIYFAEQLYRANPSNETLEKYQSLVFETADFMASFAKRNGEDGKYHLCPPLIPAQEHFKPTETSDPAFELTYWAWGLETAQLWRKRLDMTPDEQWQNVIDNLASIPEDDLFYLPTAEAVNAFTNFEMRRDHPIVVGAYGMLPNSRIDLTKMSATFDEVMREWNWQSTWGWDYPLLAMTATRLHKPQSAIDALFIDTQKNTYLVNGHNYQTSRLSLYLPGNGGLLAAVAMMAAGFEGSTNTSPGFPKDGTWDIRWEGLQPIF